MSILPFKMYAVLLSDENKPFNITSTIISTLGRMHVDEYQKRPRY